MRTPNTHRVIRNLVTLKVSRGGVDVNDLADPTVTIAVLEAQTAEVKVFRLARWWTGIHTLLEKALNEEAIATNESSHNQICTKFQLDADQAAAVRRRGADGHACIGRTFR